MTALRYYIEEVFEPTLLFGFLTGLIGVAAAGNIVRIAIVPGVLAILGVVLAQIGVNLIDDYVDFKSGIDKDTPKTKFSGGSKLVVSGKVGLDETLGIGIMATAIAAVIGAFLVIAQPVLLPIVAIGAIAVFFYAKYITKIHFVAEPAVAIAFALIAVGCFIAAGGPVSGLSRQIFAFLPAGLLVASAIVVNGVPDRESDRKHGRRNAVASLWSYKNIAAYYLAIQALAFIIILYGVVSHALGFQFVAALFIAIPSAYVAAGIYAYKKPKTHEKYMAVHAISSFLLYVLLIIAYLI